MLPVHWSARPDIRGNLWRVQYCFARARDYTAPQDLLINHFTHTGFMRLNAQLAAVGELEGDYAHNF